MMKNWWTWWIMQGQRYCCFLMQWIKVEIVQVCVTEMHECECVCVFLWGLWSVVEVCKFQIWENVCCIWSYLKNEQVFLQTWKLLHDLKIVFLFFFFWVNRKGNNWILNSCTFFVQDSVQNGSFISPFFYVLFFKLFIFNCFGYLFTHFLCLFILSSVFVIFLP